MKISEGFLIRCVARTVRGGIATPRHESTRFDSATHLQCRCSSVVERRSPKPRVEGSIPSTFANLVWQLGADLGLISPKRKFDCLHIVYIKLTRDEAIASISHALSQFGICPSVSDDGLETDDSVFIGVVLGARLVSCRRRRLAATG